MQPQVVVRPHLAVPGTRDVVLAVLASGQERLRAALRLVAAEPALVDALARVVVLDAGSVPSATVLPAAVRLPAGLLRIVRQAEATRPVALARALVEAVAEPGASTVLVLDDVALTEPAALLEALRVARGSTASDVVGLRDPGAVDPSPASWWGAVLPVDAVRALGGTLPEAGDVALAELVLRADAAGFRQQVVAAGGPVPVVAEADRILLALLHAPLPARTAVLLDGLATDLRLLLGLRLRDLLARRRALEELLGRRSIAPRLRLWCAWPALRRAARVGAVERASADEWALRLLDAEMDRAVPPGGPHETGSRPSGLRLPAWPTSKRGTSAA